MNLLVHGRIKDRCTSVHQSGPRHVLVHMMNVEVEMSVIARQSKHEMQQTSLSLFCLMKFAPEQ